MRIARNGPIPAAKDTSQPEQFAWVGQNKDGKITEVFRNPPNAAGLRNSADTTAGNRHILEFPTSPFVTGRILCTANSDLDRRDNSPAAAGEVNGTTVFGKVAYMDQPLAIPGLTLPVR
jgi:hypothetical protein